MAAHPIIRLVTELLAPTGASATTELTLAEGAEAELSTHLSELATRAPTTLPEALDDLELFVAYLEEQLASPLAAGRLKEVLAGFPAMQQRRTEVAAARQESAAAKFSKVIGQPPAAEPDDRPTVPARDFLRGKIK